MFRQPAAGITLASTFVILACAEPLPRLSARAEMLLGDAPGLVAEGLEPGTEYTLTVSAQDALERSWQSTATFRADDRGRIELSRDVPSDGLYGAPEPLGLLSFMTMTPTPDGWEAPDPRDFNTLTFTLSRNGGDLASTETRQWIFPPTVSRERIGGDLVGEVFYLDDDVRLPGVLLLGGSGGGMSWAQRTAALLAQQGLVAMALAYFNATGLSSHLVEIPLEYVESALDTLKSRSEVDSTTLGIVGYSKGAELALLVASQRADVGRVAAIAPGSAVFQGFRPPDYPVVSSWSVDGVGLPFVPNAYDRKFFETFDGMYLWYRTLAQHDAVAAAAIPVERINGDILLLSGVDDEIWPATYMAEQIVARLYVNDFEHTVSHLAFPEAGHGIAAPPGEPLTSVAERLGGTVAGNAHARSRGWRALLALLDRTQ